MNTTTVSNKIIYPERDGMPMGETDVHVNEITDLLVMLKARYRHDMLVYVGANMLCYYEEGVPASTFCPDVFVVFGVPKKSRRTFKFWEEKQPPTVVFEVTSRESRLDDLGKKKYLYASLGVEEYFVYDPLKEYLRPPLQGFRLAGSDYQPLEPDAKGFLTSRRLGLRMKLEQNGIALFDTTSGQRLFRPHEIEALAKQEGERAQHEREGRLKAEAELEKLRQQLKKRNGK